MMATLATLPTTTTSTLVGRKRSHKSATPREVPTQTKPPTELLLRRDPARPGPRATDMDDHPGEPEEEKWAVHLLLLLKATDSAHVMSDDDEDNDSELESVSDSNDQSESDVEDSRTRSSMAVDGDEEADDEEVSDVDVDSRSPADNKNESEAVKSESESESEDSNSMMDEEEEGDNDEDEEDEQPEEEDFSEGDEYVDPSTSTSSSSRRSRSHATRRQPSSTPSPASASMTPHHHHIAAPATTPIAYAQIKPELHSSQGSFAGVQVAAAHSPLSLSTASASAGSSKKTRKPKYSAALEARWEEKFEWLLTYKRVKGNCRVAEGNKEYPGLGKWLSNQKTLCKKGKLKAERRQKLIDVGAIADPALRSGSPSAARTGAMTSSSPPSSPSSSSAASPRLGMGADHPGVEGGDDDLQGPLTKRRRKGHELVVNIERIPSMSSDQEVDSVVSSPSTTPATATAAGLFSASSPFRTFQGKPILPSLSFPHPMAPGGLHPYLPPQQPQTQQQQSVGNGSFLSFALTAMPPTVLFPPYSILSATTSGPSAPSAAANHL